MNPVIRKHFEAIEVRLIDSPVITSYEIIRRQVAHNDGKLRLKARLSDGGTVELFEYVAELQGRIELLKYSFHWQDGAGKLNRRWDNAPHHPHLPNAPHHVHYSDDKVKEALNVPDIFFVIDEIEKCISTTV